MYAQLTRCFSAVAELLVLDMTQCIMSYLGNSDAISCLLCDVSIPYTMCFNQLLHEIYYLLPSDSCLLFTFFTEFVTCKGFPVLSRISKGFPIASTFSYQCLNFYINLHVFDRF